MTHIEIQTSIYAKNKYSTRLSISLLDNNGFGVGTRIKGPKYNDFNSLKEINVSLNLAQAKELQVELSKYIKALEEELK